MECMWKKEQMVNSLWESLVREGVNMNKSATYQMDSEIHGHNVDTLILNSLYGLIVHFVG